VSIDHATPAVFYAHQPSRNMYYEIGYELATSDFDFFAGGDLKRPDKDGMPNLYDLLEANGFVYTNTLEGMMALEPGQRALATTRTQNSKALAYEIDRAEGLYGDTISLEQFVEKGVEMLDNPDGFFMMVEGGKIDWANHANDARASIDDTIAFDNAVKVALEFAEDHPYDTLIVVTADHECGGMTLGFSSTNYDTAYEMLAAQTNSFQGFNEEFFYPHKQQILDANGGSWDPVNDMSLAVIDAVEQYFGLVYDDGNPDATTQFELTSFERGQLEEAYDRSLTGQAANSAEEDYQLYGYYEPFTVTLTHILNEKAGIAFTSWSHTGAPVPVLAEGAGSLLFNGFYDNTDLGKKIARAMGVEIGE
jgi:alkaline phosphatase